MTALCLACVFLGGLACGVAYAEWLRAGEIDQLVLAVRDLARDLRRARHENRQLRARTGARWPARESEN